MKKISLIFTCLFLFSVSIFAQNQFISSLNDLMNNWIRPAYPILAGIVFIVGALMNFGHFFGETRDVKKGVSNILLYLGVAVVIGGIFEAIISLSI